MTLPGNGRDLSGKIIKRHSCRQQSDRAQTAREGYGQHPGPGRSQVGTATRVVRPGSINIRDPVQMEQTSGKSAGRRVVTGPAGRNCGLC